MVLQGLLWCIFFQVPVVSGPSKLHTLCGAVAVVSDPPPHPRCAFSLMPRMCARRPSKVHTLPGASDFSSMPPDTPAGAPGCQVERRLELLLQENSPNCPLVSFSF